MANLVLNNLVKAYGKTEILHGINLDVDDGEFVVFVGPSGCGKSTTLRLIAGLEEITSGAIEIGGREVNNLEPKERDIAMVFQNYAIYPHMSVKKNIAFGLRSSKASKAEKEKRIQEVAGILDMVDLLERKPDQLSGGQRQRVAIGRAMVRDPAVFLFDEPLSNLDAKLRTQMRLEIKKLHQRVGNTIIFVTHDQVEAMTMADRIVIMKDGYIQQVGTPDDVYNRPANTFVATFIGAPSMNMIDGEIVEGGVSVGSEAVLSVPIEGHEKGMVTVGIRPDDLKPDIGTPVLKGTVTVCEPLGPETLLYVETGQGEVIAKADGRTAPQVGDSVQLGVDLSTVHLFDHKTGVALTS
ncbi:ABC transporter ATP-binding protein [Cochlodiniinecator piscidefendens]|uniref:ABC transporter ATP-binding protein n=1 Tax=Cochlodiniinecator piscidefendens TaxID=2715756 RepID=UPI00140B9128|nr:sn-glycerol-3-phosphate ABC transporter ATP-binding protein UgpC [Cochlodiniinecator piscidefendens]